MPRYKVTVIELQPQWEQRDFSNTMFGLSDGIAEKAIKAAKGGPKCLETFARKSGISIRSAKVLGKVEAQ